MMVLEPIRIEDHAALAAMMALYFPEVVPQIEIDPHERAKLMLRRADLTLYWFIEGSTRLGFAAVRDLEPEKRELAEFYIDADHRRKGVGTRAAHLVFGSFPGGWKLGVASGAKHARSFWDACLSTMPNISNRRDGAPLTDQQLKSIYFDVTGPEHD